MPDRASSFADPVRPGNARVEGHGGRDGRLAFRRSFISGDAATREILGELVEAMHDAGLNGDDVSNVELILAEVLNNVAEHAYADGAGPVELQVQTMAAGVLCLIADKGRPLPDGLVPDPALPRIAPPDHLPEGGFGWHIIRCLTDSLAYRQEGGWNRLSLRMPYAG